MLASSRSGRFPERVGAEVLRPLVSSNQGEQVMTMRSALRSAAITVVATVGAATFVVVGVGVDAAQAKGGVVHGSATIFEFSNPPFEEGLFASVVYGRTSDRAYVGDWDGNGSDTLAARRGNTYFLQGDVESPTSDRAVSFGRAADETYVGDWDGDGTTTPAVRRGNVFHFTDRWEGGAADRATAFGKPGDRIFVGDWDGDGTDTLAIVRNGHLHLTDDLSTGRTSEIIRWWFPDDTLVHIGDWDGDGRDTIGLRYPYQPPRGYSWSDWALYDDLAGNTPLPGRQLGETFRYGGGSGAAFAGDWDGDGRDELGGRFPF